MIRRPTRPFGPHPVESDGKTVLLPVRAGEGFVWTKVSPADYALAMRWPWRLDRSGYVVANQWNTRDHCTVPLALHRLVCRAPRGYLVDHKRGDLLDCRRGSLRRATPSQNSANRLLLLPNKLSRYRGVTLHRKSGKWQAQAKQHDRFVHGGLHDTEEAAARAYNALAKRLWGRFAVLNNLPDTEGARIRARVA